MDEIYGLSRQVAHLQGIQICVNRQIQYLILEKIKNMNWKW
jgi:hypothetical protein